MKELLRLQSALGAVWPELDALLGDKAATFESQLLPLLRAAEAEPFKPDQLNAVYAMLESYESVYERLLDELAKGSDDFRGIPLAVRPAAGRFITVPVWYATDRKRSGSPAPKDWYGGECGALAYGRVEVSIPDSHTKGKLEKPNLFRLQFRQDPEKHIVLLTLAELDPSAWQSEIVQGLAKC